MAARVVEGWAIYDRLRQSGKKISCTVEGKAASMATIIMLAAPKESRKAYENAVSSFAQPFGLWLVFGRPAERKGLEEPGRGNADVAG